MKNLLKGNSLQGLCCSSSYLIRDQNLQIKTFDGFARCCFLRYVRLQNSRIFCERELRTIFERKAGASEKTARENGERR